MFRYTGGQMVGSGTYWDVITGKRVDIEKEGRLPGENGNKYIKASSWVIVLLGPLVGLAYVVLLPIVSIVIALALMVRRILGGVFSMGKYIASFGWRPTEAYLGGKNKKKDDTKSDKQTNRK